MVREKACLPLSARSPLWVSQRSCRLPRHRPVTPAPERRGSITIPDRSGHGLEAPAYNDTAWGREARGRSAIIMRTACETCATVIDIGPVSARFPIYFRRSFNVASPESIPN